MRPPEGLKEWFDKMEQEQLSMLDEPGGWKTRSRRYRVVFATSMTILLVAITIAFSIFLGEGVGGVAIAAITAVVFSVWFWILALDPERAIRISNWRGRRKTRSS